MIVVELLNEFTYPEDYLGLIFILIILIVSLFICFISYFLRLTDF